MVVPSAELTSGVILDVEIFHLDLQLPCKQREISPTSLLSIDNSASV